MKFEDLFENSERIIQTSDKEKIFISPDFGVLISKSNYQ